MRLAPLGLASAVAAILAHGGCGDRSSPRPADAPTLSPAPQSVAACEAITACDACSSTPGCRFCTEPRACVREGASCGGLALSHPSTCTNDPAVGGSQRARALSAIHAGLLAEVRDMQPGPRIDARLERLTSLVFPIPAGTCHALVWTAAEDATMRDVTVTFDFLGPRGSTGATMTPLVPVGWSGRACTSVPGQLVVSIVEGADFDRPTTAGSGAVTFVLHTRPRSPADPDEGGRPRAAAPPPDPARPGASHGQQPPARAQRTQAGSVGVDCQDCTFPCESSRRDCERRCFVDERDRGARSTCERTCEQIERSCLRGCPGCW